MNIAPFRRAADATRARAGSRLLSARLAALLATALLSSAGLLAQAPQAQAGSATPSPLEPSGAPIVIPEVDLEGLEPAIAAQLQEIRATATQALRVLKEAPAPTPDPAASSAEAGAEAMDPELVRTITEAADALANLGRHYQSYEFYEAASAAYQASLQLRLDEQTAYLLAMTLRELSLYEDALTLFSVIASRQPNYVAARYYQALTLFDLGRFDASRATIPAPTDPIVRDSAAFQVLLGRLAMQFESPENAVTFFDRAIEIAPEANRTHYLLAQAHRALGNREQAAAALSAYGPVGAKPSDPLMAGIAELRVGSTPYLLSGRRAFAAGRYAEAAELFRQALEAQPGNPIIQVNLASALAQSGDVEGATSLLEEVLAASPENPTASYNLALLLIRQRTDFDRAVELLDTTIRLQPDDIAAKGQKIRVLAGLGRTDEALATIDGLRGHPSFGEELRLTEVDLLLSRSSFELAATRLEEALAALPASGRIARAGARFFARVPSLEQRDGFRALELASLVYEATNAPEDALAVAWAQAENDQCARAVEWIETARRDAEGSAFELPQDAVDLEQRARSGSCRP